MLNILFVSPNLFYPENLSGVNKTIFNILKDNASLRVTFLYPKSDAEQLVKPEGFDHVSLESISIKKKPKRGIWSKIYLFCSRYPFIREDRYLLKRLGERVAELIDDYDLVQLNSLAIAPILDYLSLEKRKKVTICAIDSLSYFYESRLGNEKNYLKKLIWLIELRKARKYETAYYAMAKAIFFVSPEDRDYAEGNLGHHSSYIYIPYGVDTQVFNREVDDIRRVEFDGDSLIFTGNMNYAPNVEAAQFLIEQVMPLLWRSRRQAKLYLAGSNPSDALLSIKDDRIIVTGFVDSLVPYLTKCKIFVSPIFFGAGVKTKVLEAMFLEKIVVGSPGSFKAIMCEDKKDCLIVKKPRDAAEWVKVIDNILNNFDSYQMIGPNAKKSIINNHDWSQVRLKYNKIYENLA